MTRIKNELRLVLFDIDGTLLWPKGAGRASTRAAMLEVFGTVGALDDHAFGGKTDWQTLVELLGRSEEEIGQIMPRYEQVIARHLTTLIGGYAVEACPGALALVHALHRDDTVLLGVVTGNVSTTAPIKLQAAGFNPAWFPVGAYGSEALDRNRLPALALERAVRHYKHSLMPQQVIVVGDTTADIASARALGARAVAVKTGYETPQALAAAGPDELLDDLTTFWQILR